MPRPEVTSKVHDCVLSDDKSWHSWQEFGDYVHFCCCGAVESHHGHMVALSGATE